MKKVKLTKTIYFSKIGVVVTATYEDGHAEVQDIEVFNNSENKNGRGFAHSIIEMLGDMSSEDISELYGIDWEEVYMEYQIDSAERYGEMLSDLERENDY